MRFAPWLMPRHRFEKAPKPLGIGVQRAKRRPGRRSALHSAARRCAEPSVRWSRSRRGDDWPSPACRRCRKACGGRERNRRAEVLRYSSPRRSIRPSATRASRKSRAERGWRPRRPVSSGRLSGRPASSVKTPISTALKSTFEAQKPRPICMMWSKLGCCSVVAKICSFRWLRDLALAYCVAPKERAERRASTRTRGGYHGRGAVELRRRTRVRC